MEARICYAHLGRRCVLRLVGEVRHTVSSVVEAIISEFLKVEESPEFIIDLTETVFIDSTNLGLIARIARETWRRGAGKPILVSSNADINAVIQSMGFAKAFDIVETHEATSAELHEAPTPTDYADPGKARRLLEAHEALIDLDERNRQTFQQVVDVLRRDSSREK